MVPAVLTLKQVASATGGELIGEPERRIGSVTTDSRGQVQDALFVALEGDRFDGHDYAASTLSAGAGAVLISNVGALPIEPRLRSAVVVEDTLVALQELATWYRRQMGATVAALTGSAGKTTTKELVASILSFDGPTLKTLGNLNNHIGVPLTLLRLEPSHRYAVIEMGCNGFGEIARLAELAQPLTAALITNVGEAHLEGLGDLDGVARAKGELFANLPSHGTAVVNVDDERVSALPTTASRRLTFGKSHDAAVRLLHRQLEPDGRQQLEIELADSGVIRPSLMLLGRHNAINAVSASALAFAIGVSNDSIEGGLNAARAAPGRLELRAGRGGLVVIDDSYNSNPTALEAALDVLAENRSRGSCIHALLGEMLELGPEGPKQHERLGRYAAGLGLETLISTGSAAHAFVQGAAASGMNKSRLAMVETPEEAAARVLERAGAKDVILIKGSRGAHMERAVDLLCEGVEERGREGAP